MKLKQNFVLRQVADSWVVLPVGSACVDFNGMLTLNDSGVILWKALEQGCNADALTNALCAEYEVDFSTAQADANEFLAKLKQIGCLEE